MAKILNFEYQKIVFLNKGTLRLKKNGFSEGSDFFYHIGDANKIVKKMNPIDYIVTSPPYHNILRNNGNGLRKQSENGFRNGSRIGVEYYSEHKNDLGNKESYKDFLFSFQQIMKKCFAILNSGKYVTIIISDFTIKKKETCVQADVVKCMQNCGFEFVGTTILLQDNKPLYPFGYPYAYKINHQHQNIIHFRKAKT
jgi:DNA modification methylase